MIILVRSVFLAVVLGECIGCASLSTAHGGSDGLVYYLPKRLLIASVTMSAMDPKATDQKLLGPTLASVDVVVTDPFPDLSTKYVAKYNRNWVGQNSIKLVSSTSGLLTSAESITVPKIKEALVSVAKAAAEITILIQVDKEPPKKECQRHGQTYRIEIDLPSDVETKTVSPPLCGVVFEIMKQGTTQQGKTLKSIGDPGTDNNYGVFYRRDEPYLVKATVDNDEHILTKLIMAPNNSPIEFLPITRSLFAKNTAKIALKDGIATGYDEEVESEVAGLLELPAGVIEAYFGAIGALFRTRTEGISQEEAYLNVALHSLDQLEQVQQKADAAALRALLLENFRLQRCREAYRADDAAAIAKECGN